MSYSTVKACNYKKKNIIDFIPHRVRTCQNVANAIELIKKAYIPVVLADYRRAKKKINRLN